MFVSTQQLRLALVAIGLFAALVLALDLARVAGSTHGSPAAPVVSSIPRNTPGSTAHLRVAYRESLLRQAASS
jgi:hypothetical protein